MTNIKGVLIMKIKDVESRVGITKANIRYYEKEGLISPERNGENNYREYSEKDVAQLERIKVLRILGVPISDIRELHEGNTSLDTVMAQRLNALQEEEKNLEAVRRVCKNLMQSSLSYEGVTEEILAEEKSVSWSRLLAKILKEDITQDIITPAQFNNNLALLLAWGYFICAIISFLLGNWFLSYEGTAFSHNDLTAGLGLTQEAFPFAVSYESFFIVPIIFGIVCYIAMYFTANIIAQIIILHICALNLSPLAAAIYMYIRGLATLTTGAPNTSVSNVHLSMFWFMIVIYVLILFLLSKTWNTFFSKARYVLITAAAYTAIMTLLIGALSGLWIPAAAGFTVFTLYIGLNWFHAYNESAGSSRYFAVSEGCRIMNLSGVIFNMRGLTKGPFVLR